MCAFFAAANPAAADIEAGVDAYRAGDYRTAYREFSRLAETGDARGQFNLGILYLTGLGVERDIGASLEWHRKAATQGLPAAQHGLGVFFYQGNGVKTDYAEALKWFRLAAGQGFANSQFNIAVMYFNEQGLIRNDIEIVKWVSLAAGQGFVPAILRLAEMYEKGIAFTQNDREALHWYRLAADRGDSQAAAAVSRLQQDAGSDTRETSRPPARLPADAAAEEPEAPPMPRPLVTAPPLPVSASPSASAGAAPVETGIPPGPAAARSPGYPTGRPAAIAEPPAQARPPAPGTLPTPQPERETGPSVSPASQAALPERSGNTAQPEEWRVQFASFRNIADAFNAWQSLKDAAGDTLAGVEPIVAPADLGERGIYHRLQAGPLASGDAARALCARVQSVATRQDCLVVRVPAQ